MRRLTRVLDDSAPDVDHPSDVQSRIRVFLPPEASTFMAKGQVTAKASVDEALQGSQRVACIGMAELVHHSPDRLFHFLTNPSHLNLPHSLLQYLTPSP